MEKGVCNVFFFSVASMMDRQSDGKNKAAEILRNNSGEKIVPIEWKWPFFLFFGFFIVILPCKLSSRFYLILTEEKKTHYNMDISSRNAPVVSHAWVFMPHA